MSSSTFSDLLEKYKISKKRPNSSDKDSKRNYNNRNCGIILFSLNGNILQRKADEIFNALMDFADPKKGLDGLWPYDFDEETALDYKSGNFLVNCKTKSDIKYMFTRFIFSGSFWVKNTRVSLCHVFPLVSTTTESSNDSLTSSYFLSDHLLRLHRDFPCSKGIRSFTSSIIIARYSESLSWMPDLWQSKQRVYVYNKGIDDIEIWPSAVVKRIENVGRESHTYLYHIIEHYEDLTDVIYFTQANPFDHAPYFIDCVNATVGVVTPFTMLGSAVHTIRHQDVSKYEASYPGMQAGFIRNIQFLFGVDASFPLIKFTPGAIITVQRETIRARPKKFYEDALTLLSYDTNPIEGFSFERVWSLIFQASS